MLRLCFRCHPGKWLSDHVGPSTTRRRQLCCPRTICSFVANMCKQCIDVSPQQAWSTDMYSSGQLQLCPFRAGQTCVFSNSFATFQCMLTSGNLILNISYRNSSAWGFVYGEAVCRVSPKLCPYRQRQKAPKLPGVKTGDHGPKQHQVPV